MNQAYSKAPTSRHCQNAELSPCGLVYDSNDIFHQQKHSGSSIVKYYINHIFIKYFHRGNPQVLQNPPYDVRKLCP